MCEERKILKACRISGFADEICKPMDGQIEAWKRLGLSLIEFRSADNIGVSDYTLEQAEALQKKLEANGMRVATLGSYIGCYDLSEEFTPHLQLIEHSLELADIFGTKQLRMFSGRMPKGKSPYDYTDEALRRTEIMVKMAARKGMVLVHENEGSMYGGMADCCLGLMKEFAGENYGTTFDFANFVQCGQDTLEAYEMLAPYIKHVHVKDALAENGKVVVNGTGDGHLGEIFKRLDADRYTGYLSLEPHMFDGENSFVASLNALKRLLA